MLFDPEAVPGASPNGIGHVFTSYWARRLGTSASGRASGRKGAECLNEKIYKSERELRSAVDRYFATICYREPVTRMVPVLEDREFIKNGERIVMQCPALDKYGHQPTADRSSALALGLWLSIHDRHLPAVFTEQGEVPEYRRLHQSDRRASAAYRADHAITFHYQITTLFPTLQVLLSPPSPFVLKRYTFTRRNVSGPRSALFVLFWDPIHI